VLAGLGLAVVTGVIVYAYARAERYEAWPSFVMVYRDTARNGGTGAMATQTIQLVYIDQRHFSSTVIAHSTHPEVAGYTQTVSGSTSTTVDPRLGVTTATLEGLTVPDDWLVPGRRPPIAFRSGATTATVDGGLLRVTVTSDVGGKREVEEVTYRASDGIPTGYVVRVDGVEVRRVEVLQFHLGAPGGVPAPSP
jgi:hypothetical protein